MKQGVLIILDKDKRVREQIQYLKKKYKIIGTPTMTAIVRALVNEKYNQLKNEKI